MTSEVEVGIDQLWKFQLRREHAVLLEEMKIQNSAFAAFAEEAKAAHLNLQEQIQTLKSNFDKLADDNEKRVREIEGDLRQVQEKSIEVEKTRDDLKALLIRIDILEGQPTEIDSTEKVTRVNLESSETSLSIKPANTTVTKATEASTTSTTRRRGPSRKSVRSTSTGSTSTAVTNKKPSQNIANTGLRKSRRQARQSPSPIATSTPTYMPLPSPSLNQDQLSLSEFAARIDIISSTVAPEDQRPLAAMFITGLTRREDQNLAVGELEKRGLAKGHGKRQVDIRAEWGEMRHVLEELGMVLLPPSTTEGAQMAAKRRKK